MEELRQKLTEAESELSFYRSKHNWLMSALASQRHARQVLEAGISAQYNETIKQIRRVVNSTVPAQATLIVISKGDEELVQFKERKAWHFPQDENGVYAGYYPANSTDAISQLKTLITKGGNFLLLPNTAFWWLEHYGELKQWLEQTHALLFRDERCAIYRLTCEITVMTGVNHPNGVGIPSTRTGNATMAKNSVILLQADSARKRPDVFCFPIIDWDFRFQRPQQLMLRFAAAGHRVFYLTHRFRKSGVPYTLRELAPSVWEVSLRGPRYSTYQGVLDDGYCDCMRDALSSLCTNESVQSAVTVVQSPFWWPLAKQAASSRNWRVMYDCMDHHAGFGTSNPMLIEQERDLFQQADLVVTSSAVLETQARRYAKKVVTIRNGCDYKHFAAAGHQPRGRRPVIGYYGAIADWFDSDLVADLAERRQDWDFLLVGSTFCGDLRRLLRRRNVSLPGEKPYLSMPEWLARFNVAILPFKRNALTEAANPVKAYEIFASGKPLVSVPLPEMVPLAPLARLASTVDEFEREIVAELNAPDQNLQRQRRAFAQNNTWEKRFEKMSEAMEDMLAAPRSKVNLITARPNGGFHRARARGLQNPGSRVQQADHLFRPNTNT
jgi:hypothetical protein